MVSQHLFLIMKNTLLLELFSSFERKSVYLKLPVGCKSYLTYY
jgi:hypothetical protein